MNNTLRLYGTIVAAGVLLLSACTPAPTMQMQNINQNVEPVANSNINAPSIRTNTNETPNSNNINTNGEYMPIDISADSPPPEGCTWETHTFTNVSFRSYKCPAEDNEYSRKNGGIYILGRTVFYEKDGNVLTKDGEEFGPLMQTFSKQQNESNIAAVTRIASASAKKPANCEVKLYEFGNRVGAQRYEYLPTEAAQNAFETANPDAGFFMNDDCGTYARTNAVHYFEFQPNTNKFLFMRLGQDESGIDLDSVTIK